MTASGVISSRKKKKPASSTSQRRDGKKNLNLSIAGHSCGGAPHRGQLCPQCGQGRLDYDGLLNLVCPACGYTSGGGFT